MHDSIQPRAIMARVAVILNPVYAASEELERLGHVVDEDKIDDSVGVGRSPLLPLARRVSLDNTKS